MAQTGNLIYLYNDKDVAYGENVDNAILFKAPEVVYEEVALTYSASGSTRNNYIVDISYFDPTSGITIEVWGEGRQAWDRLDYEGSVLLPTGTQGGSSGGYCKTVYTGGTYSAATYDWSETYTRFYVNLYWKLNPIQDQLYNYNRVTTMNIPSKNWVSEIDHDTYDADEFDLCGSRNGLYLNNTGDTKLSNIQINNKGAMGGYGYRKATSPYQYKGGGGALAAGPNGVGVAGEQAYIYTGGYGTTGSTGGGSGGNGRHVGQLGSINFTDWGAGVNGGFPSGGGGGSNVDTIPPWYYSDPGLGKIVMTYYGVRPV